MSFPESEKNYYYLFRASLMELEKLYWAAWSRSRKTENRS